MGADFEGEPTNAMTHGASRLYFDHNASAPLLPEAREALLEALDAGGNPSSVHAEGRRAHATVEHAREAVAALVGAEPACVVFTSGATEAANLALTPDWTRSGEALRRERLAVCAGDHPCLTAGGRFDPAAVEELDVDARGVIDGSMLRAWAGQGAPGLLAFALANNESGVVQPVDPVREGLAGSDTMVVVDAVQAAGRMPLHIASLGADALILSGHKIGAATGVGALVLRDEHTAPARLLRGGAQEGRLRAGTQAVAAIASFGAAARIALRRTNTERAAMLAMRERLEARLRGASPEAVFVGEGAVRLPNTLLVAAPGLRGETAQIALDLQGFAVSSGSACASGKVDVSPVLSAYARGGLAIEPALGAVRISFGFETTDAEIDAMADAIAGLLGRARAREAA